MTHQQLLDGYTEARLAVIYERSGDFSRDTWLLSDKVRAYALANGLSVPIALIEAEADNPREVEE